MLRIFKSLVKVVLYPRYQFRILLNDLKSYFGISPGKEKTIFIAGYPKSGTTWMENFTSNIPGYNPRVLHGSREILRNHNLPIDAFSKIRAYQYSSIKTHISAREENLEILVKNNIKKIIVMYRDPRDIVISNYNYVLKNNPWDSKSDFYKDYNKISKEDAIMHSIEMTGDFSSWVDGWINTSICNKNIDCLIIKYEELRNDPKGVYKKVLSFYGIKLNEKQFNKLILACNKTSNKAWLPQSLPGTRSTLYIGVSGGWKKSLNIEHKRKIKKIMGKSIVKLGYESNLKW